MYDVRTIKMQVEKGDGMTKITVKPEDVYPAIIMRIQDVLGGANPNELLASAERGGSARADVLIRNGRSLPDQAWSDALTPRDQFAAAPYSSFVEKNGTAREDLLKMLDKKNREAVMRMIQRGYALEIAYGWFCQAIRLEFGAYDLTIERNEAFRL